MEESAPASPMRLLVCLLCLLTTDAFAQPGVPALTGRVVDLADLIDPVVEDVLVSRLAAFEDSTGHQMAVLTVPSLNGEVLETFATEVFRTWGLGGAERDDGVLLLVARDDRKIRIEVGYGLEGDIPDAYAARIIRDEMTPRFRGGDFGGGITGAVDVLIAATTRASESQPQVQSQVDDAQRLQPFVGYEPWLSTSWWAHVLLVLALGGLALWLALRSFAREALAGRLFYATLATAGLVFVIAQIGPGLSLVSELLPVGGGLVDLFLWLLQALVVLFPLAFIAADIYTSRSPAFASLRARRTAIQRASRSGKRSARVGGTSYRVPRWNASTTFSGSGGGGSYRSRSSGSSFSGGGGSSGGGGASGSW